MARDDESSLPSWLALPGGKNIGLGRHWHGLVTVVWVANGFFYVGLLFLTGQWRRIVPTSWDVFPSAWESMKVYAGFNVPGIEHFTPALAGERDPEAAYLMVTSFGLAQKMHGGRPLEPYYSCIPLADCMEDESILSWSMNDQPLPLTFGAPLRLRVESIHGRHPRGLGLPSRQCAHLVTTAQRPIAAQMTRASTPSSFGS